MELSIYRRADPRLVNLQRQFSNLDRELADIQIRYDNLRSNHGQKCVKSLKEAISGLLEVVEYVNKADSALIYWVEKGGTLKRALRCVGIDKRTQAIAKTKTKRIVGQVSKVENQFNLSSEVFLDGLKAVQTLNTTVTRYSLSSLGDAGQQAASLCNDLESEVKSVQLLLEKSRLQCETIEEEAGTIPSQISGLGSQRQAAQAASDSSASASLAGFAVGGIAAVGSFFFPPLAVVAVAAGSCGVGSAVTSSGYTAQVSRLRQRESELQSRLTSLRSQIETLEESIPELYQKRASYAETKNSVETLQARCGELRQGSQAILDELLQARMVLSRTQMKTRAIASELSECGYLRTRREIAGKLRDIVEGIQAAGNNKTLHYNHKGVARALGKLLQIEGRTHSVMMIINRSS